MEYGYSRMGYEIAGGLGVALAEPDRPVYVLVGDGSYLMMNSEIATAVMMGIDLTLIVVDNRAFGCIHRLQRSVGGQPFNNRLTDSWQKVVPDIDFVMHASAMGAQAEKVADIAALEEAIGRAATAPDVKVIVIETDATAGTDAGGTWWDVAVPEVSSSPAVRSARAAYAQKRSEIEFGKNRENLQ